MATPAGPEIQLLLVSLSDSFVDFWPLLAREANVPLASWDATAPLPTGAALVLIAGGGCEDTIAQHVRALEHAHDVPVLAVGSEASHRLAAEIVRAGADDYFVLPEDRDPLRGAVATAVARRRAVFERSAHASLEAQAHAFREIVGESPALKAALGRAARVVPHGDATVLITGETGTGKELLARALHYGGPRATAPFIELNCAALPPQLLESELFGHERGAFTDAKSAKPGLFEVADGGTLFLDEIDRLAPELQAKLLRALELKQVRRVGATASRTVNVRIVAATNADLPKTVAAGGFREDLYYRLNVIMLSLPPLRARGDDVLILAEHFLRKFSAQYALPVPTVSPGAKSALRAHPWRGNVRELRNTVERTLLLSAPGTFEPELPATTPVADSGKLPFPATLAQIQRAAAQAMLDATDGNRSEAARQLGISRSRLLRLLRGREEDGAEGIEEEEGEDA